MITLVLSVAAIFSGNAQDTKMNKSSKQSKVMNETQSEQTVQQRAEMRTNQMAEELKLTQAQTERLVEVNKQYYSDYDARMGENVKAVDRNVMEKRSMTGYDRAVKNVLNDEQYQAYTVKNKEKSKEVIVPAERATTPNNKDVENYERPR